MRPLSHAPPELFRRIDTLAFDLDDTFLDHGHLTHAALGALYALKAAGIRLVIATGRPAGWGRIFMRQWPVDMAVCENGAYALWRTRGGDVVEAAQGVVCERPRLLEVATAFVNAHSSEVSFADDNDSRRTDVAIDIGEHRRASPNVVTKLLATAAAHGVRTHRSSVHAHLAGSAHDKASGLVAAGKLAWGLDAGAMKHAWAYIGDSPNDAAALGFFATTIGVANGIDAFLKMSCPPKLLTAGERAAGFVELAKRWVAALAK